MSKKKNPKIHEKKDSTAIRITCPDDSDEDKVVAQTFLNPTVLAAKSIKGCYKNQEMVDINALIDELEERKNQVNKGDLSCPEAMLVTQAHTLDALFTELIAWGHFNMGEYLNAAEKYMKLALKAQSQCRMTIEALAEIKNPKPYIQNNQARYQQVNNNGVPSSSARGKNSKQANKLLEDQKDEYKWMDTGAPEEAGRDDQEMETVGEKHGAKDR